MPYAPAARDAAYAHVVAGNVAIQSTAPPDVKATVPVAVPGSPVSVRLDVLPTATLGGSALAVNDVSAVTVSAVVALELIHTTPPERAPEKYATIG
jgi:hypothetical protein